VDGKRSVKTLPDAIVLWTSINPRWAGAIIP
jgi:hypothetical protein